MKRNVYTIEITEEVGRGKFDVRHERVEAYTAADAIVQVELRLKHHVDGNGIPFGRITSIAPVFD